MSQIEVHNPNTGSTRWWQAIYGKLADERTGSVCSGYLWTGKSRDMPPGILDQCSPRAMIGFGDQSLWDDYPWLDSSGALSVRPLSIDGQWYIVACRICPHRDADPRRLYSQATYWITKVERFQHLSLVALPQHLIAKPMTKQDNALDDVSSTPDADLILPPGWFKSVERYLQVLLCGRSLGVESHECSPDDFFRTILMCLGCLPATIRWRLHVGAGVYRSGDEHAFAQSFWASSGVVERKGILKVPPSEPAEAYISQLRENCRDARTLSDLHRCVESMYPNLHRWDAICADLNWQDAMWALPEVRTLEQLDRFLSGSAEARPPAPDGLRYFRAQFLHKIVDGLGREGVAKKRAQDTLVRLVGDSNWNGDWCKATEDAAEVQTNTLGMLLKDIPVDPSRVLEFNLELPQILHAGISERLDHALSAEHDMAVFEKWGRLIEKSASREAPAWLVQWRRQNLKTILQKACEGGDRTISFLPPLFGDHPDAEALYDVAVSSSVPPGRLNSLAILISTWPSQPIIQLLKHVDSTRPVVAIVLKRYLEEFREHQTDIKLALDPLSLARLSIEERKACVDNIISYVEKEGVSPEILPSLLTLWSDLPIADANRMLSNQGIRESVPSDIGEVLFDTNYDVQVASPALSRAVALEVLQGAMSISFAVAERALTRCRHTSDRGLLWTVCNWLFDSGKTDVHMRIPLIEKIRELKQGAFTVFPELGNSEDATLAARLLTASGPLTELSTQAPIDTLGKFRAYLAAFRPDWDRLITDATWLQALDGAWSNSGDRHYFEERLQTLGLWSNRQWRLLRGARYEDEFQLSSRELAIVSRVSDLAFVRFIRSGWPIPLSLMGKMTPDAIGRAYTEDRERWSLFTYILDVAEKAGRSDLARNLLLCIVDMFRRSEFRKEAAQQWDLSFKVGNIPRTAQSVVNWTQFLVRVAEIARLDEIGKSRVASCLEEGLAPEWFHVRATNAGPEIRDENWRRASSQPPPPPFAKRLPGDERGSSQPWPESVERARVEDDPGWQEVVKAVNSDAGSGRVPLERWKAGTCELKIKLKLEAGQSRRSRPDLGDVEVTVKFLGQPFESSSIVRTNPQGIATVTHSSRGYADVYVRGKRVGTIAVAGQDSELVEVLVDLP